MTHRALFGLTLVVVALQVTAAPIAPSIPMPAHLAGQVRKVVDGDTLHIVDAEGYLRVIRLTDIDAPEEAHGPRRPGQRHAREATAFLRDRALKKTAELQCFDVDVRLREDGARRERYVCRITVDGLNLNSALVDAGLAMVERWNPGYVRDGAMYSREDAARAAHRGVWADPDPVPPWVWRRTCWERGMCPDANP